MREFPSDRGQRRRTRTTSVFLALNLLAAAFAAGCLSYQRVGDRAYDRGDCGRALEAYEEAIDAGSIDSDMFHRAARCAMRFGDFSAAERYYSQALRYGAGTDVARELADFYVRTSNYVSAVRVYQFLLHREAEKQPVYNNLGTALMYAGQPFDAESYLMVAQQMEPSDPTPYVNLGLLYDRHLKQPWLAINFYECYLELARTPKNSEAVEQRVNELRGRYGRLHEPDIVACGEPYQPGAGSAVPVETVRELVGVVAEEPEDETNEPTPQPSGTDDQASSETSEGTQEGPPPGESVDEPAEDVQIDRMVTDEAEEERPSADAVVRQTLREGRSAYERGRWSDAVSRLTSVPVADLRPADQKLLGLAYLRQANWTKAAQWLEMAGTNLDDPEIVEGLFEAYDRVGDEDRVGSMCTKYVKSPEYEKITGEYCAAKTTESVD